MNTLTEFYVHNAMIDFLYNYEKRRYGYGTLQEILCELNPLPQGGTSNPAVWEEWNRCVDACLKEIIMKTSSGETAHRVYTKLQAFNAMVDFFINYYQRTLDGDLRTLMEVICSLSKDNTAPILQAEWNNAVKKALQNKNNQKFTDKFVERKLTKLQAFNAAVKFLDDYYKKTGLDIICLLGDMLFWPDGSTADPAFWFEWNDAVKKILKKQTEKKNVDEILGTSLTESQAFKAMVQFCKDYYERGPDQNVKILLDYFHLLPDGSSESFTIREKWKQCVDEALQEKPGMRRYLILCRG